MSALRLSTFQSAIQMSDSASTCGRLAYQCCVTMYQGPGLLSLTLLTGALAKGENWVCWDER